MEMAAAQYNNNVTSTLTFPFICDVDQPVRLRSLCTLAAVVVRISAGSLRGLHCALCTFTQLLQLSATKPGSHDLVPVLIQDHPVCAILLFFWTCQRRAEFKLLRIWCGHTSVHQ